MTKLNVLIIEDNEDDVLLLLRKLKKGGFDVEYVQVQEEAELHHQLETKKWDIIISDYSLPKFNGISALRIFNTKGIDIPFLIVSGTIGEELAVKAMKEGAHDYLMKQKLERLVPAIERELREAEIRSQNRQVQKALVDSEERYRRLVELSPDGIVIIRENKIVYANKSTASMVKASHPNILQGMDADLLFGKNNFEYLSSDENIVQPNMTECSLKALDGTIVSTEISSAPVLFESKNALQLIIRDVSQRKLVEQELHKLSKAVIQSPVAIVITDPAGKIEYINPKFEEQSGFSYEEIHGKILRVLKQGTLDPWRFKNLWRQIRCGEEWSGEVENIRKSGEHYWENIYISPIKKSGGEITHFVIIKEEISDRKKMEEELITAKEAAVQSDKLKTEFLAQMSHEIRTPINVLLSFSEMVRSEVEENADEDLKESFRMIDNAGRRIIRTIDLLLNMSEIQTNTYDYNSKTINIHDDILKPIVHEFNCIATQKGLDFELNLCADEPYVVADEYSTTQIFSNLVDNAINYTEDGKVQVDIKKDDSGNTVVEVIDTGIGISEEYLPNLFTPFTQESQGYTRRFEGNGLGLALVRNYCELNKAAIDVESKKGEGSTFRVSFRQK